MENEVINSECNAKMRQLCCIGYVDHTPGDVGFRETTWCSTWWCPPAPQEMCLYARVLNILLLQITVVSGAIGAKVSHKYLPIAQQVRRNSLEGSNGDTKA